MSKEETPKPELKAEYPEVSALLTVDQAAELLRCSPRRMARRQRWQSANQ